MRWEHHEKRNKEIKGRLRDIDVYDQALNDYKVTISNLKSIIDIMGRIPPQFGRTLQEMQSDIYIIGHEAGIPTEQVRLDILYASGGGKAKRFIKISDGYNDVLDISRKKKNVKKKVKRCRCKK